MVYKVDCKILKFGVALTLVACWRGHLFLEPGDACANPSL